MTVKRLCFSWLYIPCFCRQNLLPSLLNQSKCFLLFLLHIIHLVLHGTTDTHTMERMNFTNLLISVILVTFIIHQTLAEPKPLYANERDALILLREALTSPIIHLHKIWTGPPCTDSKSNWVGILCSNGHVIHIVLDDLQLRGSLPPTFLQEITYLTKLSFRNNSLFGPLPDLSGLVELQLVFLSHNLFSASIPSHYIALPKLNVLELQENILTGNIPPFNQPTLEIFNVSHNSLEGMIPQTTTLQRLSPDSYSYNSQLCGKPLDKPCPCPIPPVSPQSPPLKPKKNLTVTSIILIALFATLLPFIIMVVLLLYFKKMHLLRGAGTDEDKSGMNMIAFQRHTTGSIL